MLIVLAILLGILLIIVLWVLLVPVQLIFDSDQPVLLIRIVSIMSVAIQLQDSLPVLKLRAPFINKSYPLLGAGRSVKKKKVKENGKKTKKKFRLTKRKRKWIRRFMRIPRTFRIRELNINIDTGDYIINAYIFPLFGLLHHYRPDWNWSVNYFGRNYVYLYLQSSLIRMIYVIIK